MEKRFLYERTFPSPCAHSVLTCHKFSFAKDHCADSFLADFGRRFIQTKCMVTISCSEKVWSCWEVEHIAIKMFHKKKHHVTSVSPLVKDAENIHASIKQLWIVSIYCNLFSTVKTFGHMEHCWLFSSTAVAFSPFYLLEFSCGIMLANATLVLGACGDFMETRSHGRHLELSINLLQYQLDTVQW